MKCSSRVAGLASLARINNGRVMRKQILIFMTIMAGSLSSAVYAEPVPIACTILPGAVGQRVVDQPVQLHRVVPGELQILDGRL